jgi:hypothetical protein
VTCIILEPAPPVIVLPLGKAQVAPEGQLEAVKVTVPLKPFTGETVTVNAVLPPWETLWRVEGE